MKKLLKILLCCSLMVGTTVSYAGDNLSLVGEESYGDYYKINIKTPNSKDIQKVAIKRAGGTIEFTEVDSVFSIYSSEYVLEDDCIKISILNDKDVLVLTFKNGDKSFRIHKNSPKATPTYELIENDETENPDQDSQPENSVEENVVQPTEGGISSINETTDYNGKRYLEIKPEKMFEKITSVKVDGVECEKVEYTLHLKNKKFYKDNSTKSIILDKFTTDNIKLVEFIDSKGESLGLFEKVGGSYVKKSTEADKLKSAKEKANKSIEEIAKEKKDAIKEGKASAEAQEKANKEVDEAVKLAKKAIEEAPTTNGVEDAKNAGKSAINKVSVPTKEAEEAEKLNLAKEKANKSIEEIANKKKNAIKEGKASPEAQEKANKEVETAVELAKKAIGEASTTDGVEDAKNAGKSAINKVSVPTKEAEEADKLEKAKKSAESKIDAITLTDQEKSGKTAKSIEKAEAKLKELKKIAKEALERAKTIKDVNAVKVDKKEALKLLKKTGDSGQSTTPSTGESTKPSVHNTTGINAGTTINNSTQKTDKFEAKETKAKDIKLIKEKLANLRIKVYGLKWVAEVSPTIVKNHQKAYDETMLSAEKAMKKAKAYLDKYDTEKESDKAITNEQNRIIIEKLEELKTKVYGLKWLAEVSPTIVKNHQKAYDETMLSAEKAIKDAENYLEKH